MEKPVSDLDKMALNNIHAHHLIYVHWHKVDVQTLWTLYVNLDESDEFGTFIFRTQALIVFVLWHGFVTTMQHRVTYFHVCHCN
jgi:hypothetical protein